MSKNTTIETMAFIGKIIVDVSSLNDKHKVTIKFVIDLLIRRFVYLLYEPPTFIDCKEIGEKYGYKQYSG